MSESVPDAGAAPTRTRWLNLVLGLALASMVLVNIVLGVRHANLQADLRIALSEASELEQAFELYYKRHGGYPSSSDYPGFDKETLDPLRRRGYYQGRLTTALANGRVDGYHAPSDRGADQEYWIEMTLERDPTIRILVVHSDDAPLSGGRWLEGIHLYRKGVLKPV